MSYSNRIYLEQPHQLMEKIPSILYKKPTFSILHHHFDKNTHISLSILQNFSIKYSFFINFLLFSLMVILF